MKESKTCTNSKCSSFGRPQSLNNFGKDRHMKGGLKSRCKRCLNNQSIEYFRIHREEKRNYDKQYKQTLGGRFSQYHKDIKKRNIIFELSLENFEKLTSRVCFYCGEYSKDKLCVGIDKINPNKGYVLENCVPCCDICNWMKSDTSQNEFYSKIEKIYKKRHRNE